MTDVETQTEDILINGIPLGEFIKNNTSPSCIDDTSVWDFLKNNSDTEDDTDNDTSGENECESYNESNNTGKEHTGTYDSLTEHDIHGFRESILYCIDETVRNNPLLFSDPTFHLKLETSIYEVIEYNFSDNLFGNNDIFTFTEEMENQIEDIISSCLEYYFNTIVPPRSYPTTCILQAPNVIETSKKIEYLKSIPQDEQRTAGWYIFRNKLITASAAWKVFKSESCKNQLIYEKCKPLAVNITANTDDVDDIERENEKEKGQVIVEKTYVNTNSPLHWGQKYEKLSVMLYEKRNNTKVGEFGCIKHPKYEFLGASPDGINIDPESPLYGRMLEIKNIVNREITGTPIEEYWIQTQLQMQVCDCDECDFLETCFKEYEDEAAFLHDSSSDIDSEFYLTSAKTLKGVIAYFMKDGKPFYEYAPLYLTRSEYDKWCEEIIDKNTGITWLKNIYWYLNQYSCVLIRKNDIWFESAIKKIENVWNIILTERETGYEHRAPKKRTPKKKNIVDNENDNEASSGCLIVISDLELNI
jgi:hypothetical protein